MNQDFVQEKVLDALVFSLQHGRVNSAISLRITRLFPRSFAPTASTTERYQHSSSFLRRAVT
jgi:hypothetical protein